ncbi:hypothetical protein J0S82_013639 [Galemys pyrenaicus]|uniref:Uncharacterized protein n=1 Tax=Galemys pyrenaicus TaxID=202257 RepID=A0A8J6AIN6_GALPY|nr:hypothetical protein J0S82_013639 [Galemys pyrenaicus]
MGDDSRPSRDTGRAPAPAQRTHSPSSPAWNQCEAVGGIFKRMVSPRFRRVVYRLVGATGAGARFLLGVGGARAAESSAEAAGERAHAPRPSPASVAATAEARRLGAASPPAAPPVRPSVPPSEEPAERNSAPSPEPRPPLCRCL